MVGTPVFVGQGVLRDFPLRLWEREQEHSDGLVREFQLLLADPQHAAPGAAPVALVTFAEAFTQQFGPALEAIADARQAAVDEGRDRMDSVIPLAEGTPEILRQVREVMRRADEYCAAQQLLTLPRPPLLVALADWTLDELTAQYGGAEPTPWPGPFEWPDA